MHDNWSMRCLFCFLALLGGSVFGQETQSDVDKSRQLLRNQMELKLKDLELQAGDSDDENLGAQILVQRKPKPWTITLATDIGEIWSSNVFLVENDPVSDFALTHTDALTGNYKLTDELSFTGAYRFSLYRYNRLIIQNFDAHNATGSLNYSLPYDISVYTGVGWTMVYSKPIDDSVYEEADWNIGVSKVVPLEFFSWMKDRTAAFVGYQTDLRWSSPKDLDKLEVSPYVGLYYMIDPKVVGQLFYRWNYQHYQIHGRKDYNNSITGSVTWNPYEWMAVSGFSGYTDNNSLGKNSRNYSVVNTGGSVKFSWKF
jgi:hypothetical protein